MIFDAFKNLDRYPQIPFVKEIRAFVAGRDCLQIEKEEIEILGRELFVRVGNYETGPAAEKQFEAHTVYADLQLVISGAETMDVSLETNPKPVTDYKPDADIRFFENPRAISSVLVPENHFTVFFPGELHKPGCFADGMPGKIKKLVFKIKMPKSMKNLEISPKDKPPFLRVIEEHGDFFLIRLQGEINTHALENNQEKMRRLFEKIKLFTKPILCDFEGVTDSDTATLAAMVVRFSEFRKHGGEKLIFFNVQGELRSLLEIAHLIELFTICESQQEAEDTLLKIR